MTSNLSPLEIFDAEIKSRNEKERNYLISSYTKQVTQLEEDGIDVFTPCFNYEQMAHRQYVIHALKKLGWTMTHWSVTSHNNATSGYPVFEKKLS